MPQTSVGTPGVAIVPQCTVPSDGPVVPGPGGDLVTGAGLKVMADAINSNFATIKSGSFATSAGITFTGDLAMGPGGSLQVHEPVAFESDSLMSVLGRNVPRGARVAVPDASGIKTLGVAAGAGVDYAGKRFVLAAVPSANRTFKLKSAGVVPFEGETMEALWYSGTPPTGTPYTFEREDGTVVASFVSTADTLFPLMHMVAEFEFVGGAWRLGMNTGRALDTAPLVFGVVPGVGA